MMPSIKPGMWTSIHDYLFREAKRQGNTKLARIYLNWAINERNVHETTVRFLKGIL